MIKKIQKEVLDFRSESVLIAEKFNFNQLETLQQIIRLYNSQFKGGSVDSEGFKKYFKNIVRNPCVVATKATAFSPSSIQIANAPGGNYYKAWIADRDFKHWVKDVHFPTTLSRIFHELPIYGSVVIKKVKGKYDFVDLRNLVVEQQADSLARAHYVIEQHYLTPEELRKTNWNNVEEAIEAWRNTDKPYIRVLERRGEMPESEAVEGGDSKKTVRGVYIAYVPDTSSATHFETPSNGIKLWANKESTEDFPYREFHWEKIPGRWLGVGRVEINTDAQIRTNELTNLRVKSSYFAALNIWQTRDTTINKNLIKQVANGDVMKVMSEITRIPTEERNMAAFGQEEQGWLQNRDEQSMSFDVMRGERLPAGTPLGSAQLAAQMSSSYFDIIRKNIAASLKQFIVKDVFQDFLAQKNMEHYVKLVGEDLDQWHSLMIAEKSNVEFMKFIFKHKKLPTQEQYDIMKSFISEKEKQGKEKSIKLPKDFYKDLVYEIDIVITEQMRQMMARASNMVTILQAIQQDPALLQDPAKRNIFRQLLESIGMNLADIEPAGQQHQAMTDVVGAATDKKGGGISSPRGGEVDIPEVSTV